MCIRTYLYSIITLKTLVACQNILIKSFQLSEILLYAWETLKTVVKCCDYERLIRKCRRDITSLFQFHYYFHFSHGYAEKLVPVTCFLKSSWLRVTLILGKHFILHVIESINLHARGRKEKYLDSFLKYLQNF